MTTQDFPLPTDLPQPIDDGACDHQLTDALRLPTFNAADMRLTKRLTLIVRDSTIEACFYPVFPSDQSAQTTIDWLRAHPV